MNLDNRTHIKHSVNVHISLLELRHIKIYFADVLANLCQNCPIAAYFSHIVYFRDEALPAEIFNRVSRTNGDRL